jgi:AraC-like DNA-binding protein
MRYAGRVDALSDVITAARVGRPHSARVHRSPPFGSRFPPAEGAGFHVVLQGTCWLITPHNDPVALGPGDVAFLPSGCAHGLADSPVPLTGLPPATSAAPAGEGGQRAASTQHLDSVRGGSTVMVCGAYLLDRSQPHPLLRELPDLIHLRGTVGRHPELRAAVDLLGQELDQARPGTGAVLPALLDLLLLYILRAWYGRQSSHDAATGWAAALHDPAVAAALTAIHGNPGRPWTVAELGSLAGLSRAAFARRFTTLAGQPPQAYLTWWRMTLAARYLRESGTPLSVIARTVGYTSEYAFAHAFKRQHGQAPGQYRQTHRITGSPLGALAGQTTSGSPPPNPGEFKTP